MTREQQILDKLAKLLHSNRADDYQSAHIEYKHSPEESWSSFSSWYVIDGKNVASPLFEEQKTEAEPLCVELYQIYKSKNSDWRKFELTLENSEARVNFDYEPQDFF